VGSTPAASPQRLLSALPHVDRVQQLLRMHMRRSRLDAAFKLAAQLEQVTPS